MRINKIALALSLAAFAMPLTALAQDATAEPEVAVEQEAAPEAAAAEEESSSNLSWNLGVTTDYVFRGITQTDFDPAVQGGLDYAFGDSGFYAGVWASNVDFADPDGPDIEVDATIGYSFDLAEDWNVDLHAVRYTYLGERDVYGNIDYNEYFAALAWSEMLTFTVAYSDDYANSGFSSMYYNLGGSWELGNEFALNAGFGHTDFADDNGSYNDWNVGVSRQFGPVNAALNYYDTSGDYVDALYDGDRASDTVVLTLALGG
jgi:uncharacterized protein (TIGR02001 family)